MSMVDQLRGTTATPLMKMSIDGSVWLRLGLGLGLGVRVRGRVRVADRVRARAMVRIGVRVRVGVRVGARVRRLDPVVAVVENLEVAPQRVLVRPPARACG